MHSVRSLTAGSTISTVRGRWAFLGMKFCSKFILGLGETTHLSSCRRRGRGGRLPMVRKATCGSGEEFLTAVGVVVEFLAEYPESSPIVYRHTRGANLRRFP